MRTNWRDCQGWIEAGLPLSTSSNEACKLYDAALAQGSGMYEEPSLGGMANTIEKMMQADPEFVMGHVIANNLQVGGTERPLHQNPELKQHIDQLNNLATKAVSLTERERKHVLAINLSAKGEQNAAIKLWEDILVDYPTDLLASRQAFLTMINTGAFKELLNINSRVLPFYKDRHAPGYSNILGWQAFGLEENNHFDLAEKTAKQALEIERHETYASHTLSHVYLMQGQHDKGLDFMLSTENDWNICNNLACHNYWHIGLFHAEKGNFEDALAIFDLQVGARTVKSEDWFNLTDACSLLYRLELEGVNVENRWSLLDKACNKHECGHGTMFADPHLLMAFCRKEKGQQFVESLKDYIQTSEGEWDSKTVAKEVGIPLCEGILAYETGDYTKAIDILNPLQYDIIKIGGSIAQRDVFQQILISAALKSPKREHNQLAKMLLYERKVVKESDSWTDRQLAKFVIDHSS